MPTSHEINVTYDGKNTTLHNPSEMKVGDMVHYSSKHGPVIITFLDNGSPFLDVNNNPIYVITSAAPPLPLQQRGDFKARCFVTLPNGMTVGWGPNSPNGGGNSVVK